ncbi:MAG: hypothetical protein ACXU8U_10360 [Asticcacaulis sp.]
MTLQTPAGLYGVSETETAYGGRTQSFSLIATVWGDFRPDAPHVAATSEGDAYTVQQADFLCRSAAGMAPGGRLSLKGFDWTILSIDEAPDSHFRLRIERVQP